MSDTHNTMKDGAEKSEVAKREEEVLAFWQERDIFNKSVAKDAPHGDFVFYDGPPFATTMGTFLLAPSRIPSRAFGR
jgi:isoleucyl-tRNA synthetase